MPDVKTIALDNQLKIIAYLEEQGLTDCNPSPTPITETIVEMLYENTHKGERQTAAEQEQTSRMLGQAMWLAQTTHPTIAPAVSIYASILKAESRVKGGVKAMTHLFKYLKGTQDRCLLREADCQTGLQVWSDADFAGLWARGYETTRERRSRTGTYITYNNVPVIWVSKFQKATSLSYKGDTEEQYIEDMALSTANSELWAGAETAKDAEKLKWVCEEMQIEVPSKIILNIDAAAAIGFIDSTSKSSDIKTIDMRCEWVKMLRSRDRFATCKVPGEINEADFFTKILPGPAFKQAEDRMMKPLPK